MNNLFSSKTLQGIAFTWIWNKSFEFTTFVSICECFKQTLALVFNNVFMH